MWQFWDFPDLSNNADKINVSSANGAWQLLLFQLAFQLQLYILKHTESQMAVIIKISMMTIKPMGKS